MGAEKEEKMLFFDLSGVSVQDNCEGAPLYKVPKVNQSYIAYKLEIHRTYIEMNMKGKEIPMQHEMNQDCPLWTVEQTNKDYRKFQNLPK